MPYPESCPECASTFRNTGTHFTARRNEVGRHVLLELGCQTTHRRFWWDFTTGQVAADGQTPASGSAEAPSADPPRLLAAASVGGAARASSNGNANGSGVNGHAPAVLAAVPLARPLPSEEEPVDPTASPSGPTPTSDLAAVSTTDQAEPGGMRESFLRQLQLDRLTMRQMRGWLLSEDARRAAEVAASATEATYERLALALFGVDLPQLLGRAAAVPPSTTMSAEERLELQREKARIRARQRRAALKAARLGKTE